VSRTRGRPQSYEPAVTAEALHSRRQALALSQVALAELLGVTSNTVARWERAEQTIGNPERVSAALMRLEEHPEGRGVSTAGMWPQSTRRQNLPAPLTSFIGRDLVMS
jgi:DNA-binding transcriptional regulator YiaG